jgi:hypothetical protein
MYPFLDKGETRLRLGIRELRLGDHKDRPYAGHIQLQSALGHLSMVSVLPT